MNHPCGRRTLGNCEACRLSYHPFSYPVDFNIGGDDGIPGLVRTLLERRVNAPAGSYTKRLFDDAKLLKVVNLLHQQQ
jgi:hypothetical protein